MHHMNWNAAAVSLPRQRPWWESNGGCPRNHGMGSILWPWRFCIHGTIRLKLLALMLLLLLLLLRLIFLTSAPLI